MAITAADIENVSFSNDFRGYNVDEVDDFLEKVAAGIDELNAQIADLQAQLADAQEYPLAYEEAPEVAPVPEPAPAPVYADDNERDARIADLEAQLEAQKANSNVIAEALIVAQRAADDIVSKAKAAAADTQADAEEEARHIVDKATAEKQRILDSIANLQVEREQTRAEYQAMLNDFIEDASNRLASLGSARNVSSASVTAANPAVSAEAPAAAPVQTVGGLDLETIAATYTTPQMNYGSVIPAAPRPSQPRKDFSGFGDAADDFDFSDLD